MNNPFAAEGLPLACSWTRASITGVVERMVIPVKRSAMKRAQPPNQAKRKSITGAPRRETRRIFLRPKRSLKGPAPRTPTTPENSKRVRAVPASHRFPVSSLINVGRKAVMEACMNPRASRIAVKGRRRNRMSRHVSPTDAA